MHMCSETLIESWVYICSNGLFRGYRSRVSGSCDSSKGDSDRLIIGGEASEKVDTLHFISKAINFPRYSAPSRGLRVSPKQFSHLLALFCTCGPLLTCLMLSCYRPPLSTLSFCLRWRAQWCLQPQRTHFVCISLCISFPPSKLRENSVLLENLYNVFIENVFEREI